MLATAVGRCGSNSHSSFHSPSTTASATNAWNVIVPCAFQFSHGLCKLLPHDMQSLVAIAEALNKKNRTLSVLKIDNPRLFSLQEETTSHIARMLAVNPTVRVLTMGKHRMRDFGVETLIAYGLSRNRSLVELDLRCNELTEVAGESIGRILRECPLLEVLNLASNTMSDNGAHEIALALAENNSLRRLDLSFNKIGDRGLVSLAEGLMENASVTTIYLWGNSFGQNSAAAFRELIERSGANLKIDIKVYQVDSQLHIAKVDEEPQAAP
eukprot:jgi/Mesvir1/14257/Mv25054-RA.1